MCASPPDPLRPHFSIVHDGPSRARVRTMLRSVRFSDVDITDGRFSGGSHGFVVGHITPEAARGGPIGVVRHGDPSGTIDAVTNELTLDNLFREMKARLVTGTSEGVVINKYL